MSNNIVLDPSNIDLENLMVSFEKTKGLFPVSYEDKKLIIRLKNQKAYAYPKKETNEILIKLELTPETSKFFKQLDNTLEQLYSGDEILKTIVQSDEDEGTNDFIWFNTRFTKFIKRDNDRVMEVPTKKLAHTSFDCSLLVQLRGIFPHKNNPLASITLNMLTCSIDSKPEETGIKIEDQWSMLHG